MTQTRTFLILAWLMVATLLWMEWGKERDAAAAPAPAIPTATQVVGTATPRVPVANVPGAAPVATPVAAAAVAPARWPPAPTAPGRGARARRSRRAG